MGAKSGRLPLLCLIMKYVQSCCWAFRTKCIQVTQSLQDLFEKVCLREVGREKSCSGQFSCSQRGRPQRICSQASPQDLLAKLSEHRTYEPMSKINGITFLSPYQFLREGSGNGKGTREGICCSKQHLWRSIHCLFSLNNCSLMIKLSLKTPSRHLKSSFKKSGQNKTLDEADNRSDLTWQILLSSPRVKSISQSSRLFASASSHSSNPQNFNGTVVQFVSTLQCPGAEVSLALSCPFLPPLFIGRSRRKRDFLPLPVDRKATRCPELWYGPKPLSL